MTPDQREFAIDALAEDLVRSILWFCGSDPAIVEQRDPAKFSMAIDHLADRLRNLDWYLQEIHTALITPPRTVPDR